MFSVLFSFKGLTFLSIITIFLHVYRCMINLDNKNCFTICVSQEELISKRINEWHIRICLCNCVNSPCVIHNRPYTYPLLNHVFQSRLFWAFCCLLKLNLFEVRNILWQSVKCHENLNIIFVDFIDPLICFTRAKILQ